MPRPLIREVSPMQISQSTRLQRVKTGWKQHGEVHCEDCDEYVDLSEADTLDEARDRWNEHVDDSGGELYV